MKKPKYVHGFIDQDGRPRHYFRRRGFKGAKLPGLPWSPQFMAAYEAAMGGETLPKSAVPDRTKPGTVDALVVSFYRSPGFLGLSASTRATYRNIIERFRRDNGHRRVVDVTQKKLSEMLGNRASTPSAANNWKRMVHLLMQHAIALKMRKDDPTLGIKPYKITSEGFRIWGEEQIEAFRTFHAIGTKARLAMELAYCTIQRRSDVVRLGPQHVRNGIISIVQKKTGVAVDVPVLPELLEVLAATPKEHLAFLITEKGKPYTEAGFGGWFRERCDEAGVFKGYSVHGLRKAGATRFAEAGFTDHEIMAWGGWKTLKEVERYTRAANRKRLAKSGAEKLKTRTPTGKP